MTPPQTTRPPRREPRGMLIERVIEVEDHTETAGSARISLSFDDAKRDRVNLIAETTTRAGGDLQGSATVQRVEIVLGDRELRQLADAAAELADITDELALKNAGKVKRRLPAGGNDTIKTIWREQGQHAELWTAVVCRHYPLRRWVVFAIMTRGRKPHLQPLNDPAVILKRCWRRRDALACYQVHVETRWFWDAERTTTGWQPSAWTSQPDGPPGR